MKRNLAGHKMDDERVLVRYTVWDNKTDRLIIADGSSRQCAEMMGLSLSSFHTYLWRMKNGRTVRRWTIEPTFTDEMELDDEEE